MEINKVYCMDNLELMRSLPEYSIDLIYGDILYGTGKKFKDYQDLKADRKVIEDFYIPRIKEMCRLLKPTGSIYLQMDYRISHWIRCIMDDIFGMKSFRNEIVWCYVRPSNGKGKSFPKCHDTILFYTKDTNQYTFNHNEIRVPYSEATKSRTKYGAKTSKYTRLDDGKMKLNDNGKIPEDWWQIPSLVGNSKEYANYATQKPLTLMDRIIKASSNKGDVCADFFMGSGSFLVKANDLGRQYIGCDLNPKAVEITYNRINGFIYE